MSFPILQERDVPFLNQDNVIVLSSDFVSSRSLITADARFALPTADIHNTVASFSIMSTFDIGSQGNVKFGVGIAMAPPVLSTGGYTLYSVRAESSMEEDWFQPRLMAGHVSGTLIAKGTGVTPTSPHLLESGRVYHGCNVLSSSGVYGFAPHAANAPLVFGIQYIGVKSSTNNPETYLLQMTMSVQRLVGPAPQHIDRRIG